MYRRDLNSPAMTLADLVVGMALALILSTTLLLAADASNEEANRMKCAANLKSIGQAMLLYANENRGAFPRTMYKSDAKPTAFTRWQATSSFAPDGVEPNDVTAAIYLLMRTQDINAFCFICPSSQNHPINFGVKAAPAPEGPAAGQQGVADPISEAAQKALAAQIRSRRPATAPAGMPQPVGDPVAEVPRQISNFPSPDNLSYSMANPYAGARAASAGFKFNSSLSAEFALFADLNPGGKAVATITPDQMPPSESRARGYVPFAVNPWKFTEVQMAANSPNHGGFGQNVLWGDGAVTWQASPFVGIPRDRVHDNIYTRHLADVPAAERGDPIMGPPMDAKDAVMLPTAK